MHPGALDHGAPRVGVPGLGPDGAEILADFPDLTCGDIRACLVFAADRGRKLATSPPAA